MIRYALRRKSDGKYLSARPSWGKRRWVTLNPTYGPYPALFTTRSSLSLAGRNTMEHRTFVTSQNSGSRFPTYSSAFKFRSHKLDPKHPLEVVEFEVFLIDTKIGTLTLADIKEQSAGSP